jgi:hypothetical protein
VARQRQPFSADGGDRRKRRRRRRRRRSGEQHSNGDGDEDVSDARELRGSVCC